MPGHDDPIYPVIHRVPESCAGFTGRQNAANLSRLARQAVKASAARTGITLDRLEADASGAPLPENGYFWSVSHKPQYVAGVVSSHRVGIDLEALLPVRAGMFKKIADESEWALWDSVTDLAFYRYFTAKEAVLKACGIGLTGLSACRVHRIIDESRLGVSYDHREWIVRHFFHDKHIFSIAANPVPVCWKIDETLK